MKAKRALRGILLQAGVAMLGSLYYGRYGDPIANIEHGYFFSPLNGLAPCELCWYARILMYPIVFLAIIALYKKDWKVTQYTIPLSALGVCLEVYHYLLQKTNITTGFTCTYSNPCNALEVNYFGFITIPFLCGIAFLIILSLSVYIWRTNRNQESRSKK